MGQQHNASRRKRPVWARLGDRTRLMLQRLNDCILLREREFASLVWPEGVSRQGRAEQYARWQGDQLVQCIHDAQHGPCYQLGRVGARLLHEAGFPRIAPVRCIADRARSGLLLANQFGVALHNDIQYESAIAGMAWTIAPFSGRDARGDGLAALRYSLNGHTAPRERADAYAPLLASDNFAPHSGTAVQRFVVEIDCGTETQQQLEQRARQWRKRWEQTSWPPATHAVFLWITTAGSARLETIWRAWTHHALLPAFFTTVDTLALGAGEDWHPWIGRRTHPECGTMFIWHDMYGRPRSLCPWEGNEPAWRFAQPVPVVASSLHASSAGWRGEAQDELCSRRR